jgi:hypothetical protein
VLVTQAVLLDSAGLALPKKALAVQPQLGLTPSVVLGSAPLCVRECARGGRVDRRSGALARWGRGCSL